MIFWVTIVFIASALLVGLLVALRRYERDSATAALAEVDRLQGVVADLLERIEHLEAIFVADETLPGLEQPGLEQPDLKTPLPVAPENESATSAASPAPRSRNA